MAAGRPRVVVLDHGSGNLRSAVRALAHVGADVELSADGGAARRADGLVVPGVGAFAAVMAGLRRVGAPELIAERLAAGAPVLGICVGMQVMFEAGTEHGVTTPGLGLVPGQVRRLQAAIVPHMGWSAVTAAAGSRLFEGLDGQLFYFVHSYAAPAALPEEAGAIGPHDRTPARPLSGVSPLVATARHGQDFAAAFEAGPLAATQFHPEKSAEAGLTLLSNWTLSLT